MSRFLAVRRDFLEFLALRHYILAMLRNILSYVVIARDSIFRPDMPWSLSIFDIARGVKFSRATSC
jgi:hypothetical protein